VQTISDSFRHHFILSNLIAKEFKAQYRSMALGYLWTLAQPAILVSVLTFVWVVIFNRPISFASQTIVALVPHNFATYCLTQSTGVITRNRGLVKKVRFPRQLLPISIVITNLIHFAIQGILIVVIIIALPPPADILGWQLLWLPVLVALSGGLAAGTSMLVASLSVRYRDMQYLVSSLIPVLFWMSPIVYVAYDTMTHTWAGYLYYLNPLAGLLEAYRSVLFFGESPHYDTLLMSLTVTLVVGAIGVRSFWRHEREFADLI